MTNKGPVFQILFPFLLFALFISCQPEREEQNFRIGFSQAMTTDNWRKAMNREMMVETSMHPELELQIRDADNNVKLQIRHIEEFIEEGVDVLIVSPIQAAPVTQVIEKAMDQGIPTIVIDRKVEGNNYTAYVGANNVQIGENAANYILSHTKGATRVIEIRGLEGSSPAHERSEGFHNILDSVPHIEVQAVINGNWEKESITGKLNILLQDQAPPDFIFAHNDRMALGAWEVAKKFGLQNDISFIGVDGLSGPSGGIQLVKEDVLDATILYPTGGAEAIKVAERLIEGEEVNKNIILNTVVIDPVNVDIMKNQFDTMIEQQKDIEQQQGIIQEQIILYKSQRNLLQIMMGLLILLVLLSLWSALLFKRIKKSKRNLVAINQKVVEQRNQIQDFAQQLKKSNESKINFFTALSHEFKTPLTLITSAIESFAENRNVQSKEFAYEVSLIKQNSHRLLGLINELLNFRKLEAGSFELKPVKTNLNDFLKKILDNFRTEAVKRSIDLEMNIRNEQVELYFDRNLMEKVFFNLLSNAFKFTPNNAGISITISEKKEGAVEIRIKDTGIGIPKEELQWVFDPFSQGFNNHNPGSGLGLYLTKQFIDLHKGHISVSSHQGSEFIIVLQKGKEHLKEYQPIENAADLPGKEISQPLSFENQSTLPEELKMSSESKESVLIIEDNVDLSHLLKKNLNKEYQVHLSDGTNAIEKAFELVPDIIICDINLPEGSGYEICREFKNDLRTSHIPILMLSALSDEESRIASLRAGADGFIAKPFNFQVLKESLRSALYNREKLRYYYTNRIDQVKDEKFKISEQAFLVKLNKVIDENITNSDFTVEDLAQQLNISRIQVYRKVKALLGVNISDHINTQRLNKARNLLQDSNLNISEIAYSLGYSSPGYFSTSFKKEFGISPKQIRV